MTQYRETVLAVLVRLCSGGIIQFGLIWSGKAKICGECTHTFVGGGIEPGETAETALRRELKEEVGLSADQYELLPIAHHSSCFMGPETNDGRTKRYQSFLVVCKQTAQLKRSQEAAAANWFTSYQILGIAEQGLSANKRSIISDLADLLLEQQPDLFRGSENTLRRLSGELALAA
jgi:ADP-ribose pyrophosphatase YjhB (NUDIX family)